jgi:hypothetical protein
MKRILCNGQYFFVNKEGVTQVTDSQGVKYQFLDGKLHSEESPAVIYPNDNRYCWFKNGELHRIGGPAIVHLDGTQEYYQYNKRHRNDGPAVVNPDGTGRWYFDDMLCTVGGPELGIDDMVNN